MLKKSNNVQHFKLKQSQVLRYFQQTLYIVSIALVLFCSLEWFFKALLLLLLGLEYWRQQSIENNKNSLKVIEVRDNKVFFKRKNDQQFQEPTQILIKQNRIFVELTLQLNNEVISEFIYQDSFCSKGQFNKLMQNLRFNHL